MIINIISTVNGMENEGMRNIASHMIRELDGMCTLRRSSLGNPLQCVKNTIGADAVLVFARASSKTAYLAKILRVICSKVYFILVQKPEHVFLNKIGNGADKFSYFTILPKDGEELSDMGCAIYHLDVGINTDKFCPAKKREEKNALREKYGFSNDLPVVLHVGHLSEGRGLEEFLHLPKEKYQRLIVASGMFNSDGVEERLRRDGVKIIKEYLPDVSEVYRMADVYLFPTRSAEFVISIPLSVMEALSCGIPVVAYEGVDGINSIISTEGAIFLISSRDELDIAVQNAAHTYENNFDSLLTNSISWRESAKRLLNTISDKSENE